MLKGIYLSCSGLIPAINNGDDDGCGDDKNDDIHDVFYLMISHDREGLLFFYNYVVPFNVPYREGRQ